MASGAGAAFRTMEFYELVQAVHTLALEEFTERYRSPFLLEDDPEQMRTTVEGFKDKLLETEPPMSRRVFEVARKDGTDGPVVIGRSPAADIRLDQGSVSARHAAIRRVPGGWTLTDGHSTNGTRVGGSPAPAGVALPLRFGAKVRFGPDASFTFFEPARIHQVLKLLAPRILRGLDPDAKPSSGTFRLDVGREKALEAPSARPQRPHEGEAAVILMAHCPPLKAQQLDVGKEVRIGRTDENDLVLPHPAVSRKHATLTRDGDLVLVKDLGSANGTFLGEERVRDAAFAIPGEQTINIGPFEIRILAQAVPLLLQATSSVQTAALRRDRLEGTLETMPLTDMLQAAELNRRSGTIRIEARDAKWGEIVFADGRPLRAEMGALRGDAAVLALLRLRQGRFNYSPGVPTREPMTCEASFMKLLMEASRLDDEDTGRAP